MQFHSPNQSNKTAAHITTAHDKALACPNPLLYGATGPQEPVAQHSSWQPGVGLPASEEDLAMSSPGPNSGLPAHYTRTRSTYVYTIYIYTYVYIYLSISLSIYLSIYLSISFCVHLYVGLFVFMDVCRHVWLSCQTLVANCGLMCCSCQDLPKPLCCLRPLAGPGLLTGRLMTTAPLMTLDLQVWTAWVFDPSPYLGELDRLPKTVKLCQLPQGRLPRPLGGSKK